MRRVRACVRGIFDEKEEKERKRENSKEKKR